MLGDNTLSPTEGFRVTLELRIIIDNWMNNQEASWSKGNLE